jgi:hypothetical protein
VTAGLLACMTAVAAFYHLPPQALPAIRQVEGGRPGLVRHDADGSDDLGPMQVNTRWIAPLAHETRLSPARLRRALLADGCFNVGVAGAILRIQLDARKGDLGAAIGDYHSHTPALHDAYAARVLSVQIAAGTGASAAAGSGVRVARWREKARSITSQMRRITSVSAR